MFPDEEPLCMYKLELLSLLALMEKAWYYCNTAKLLTPY